MKKIIRFYPFNESTQQFSPEPVPASKMVPEWYRKQPSIVKNDNAYIGGGVDATIKKCMAIFDAITMGYLILAPCDIYVDATDPEKLSYSVPMKIKQFQSDLFAVHSFDQYDHYPLDNSIYHKQLLRIFPFWSVETQKGYSSMYMQPLHRELDTQAIPGIIDTDKFVSEGHMSFLIKKGFKGVIKQGTPLIQVVPFKRESWTSKVVNLTEALKTLTVQRFILRSKFINSYKENFWIKKEYK
jgi:hypothetical protein